MSDTNTCLFTDYLNNFPSTTFLRKWYGENEHIELIGFSDVAIARAVDGDETNQVTTDIYTEARRSIDYIVRENPVSFLKNLVWKSPTPLPEPLFLFRGSNCDSELRGFFEGYVTPEQETEYFQELCAELSPYCRSGALNRSDWYRFVTNDTGSDIWIEVLEVPKRRTFEELFG